jgi:ABC-type amino acid transport substrate-binding protein
MRQHRTSPVLAVMALTTGLTLAACGGGGGGSSTAASSGGLRFGNADPATANHAGAPNASAVPQNVKQACAESASPKIAAIKKAGRLNWGIGISPPFGFQGPSSKWQGVEAENAVELAGILGVEPNIVAYDYSVMTTALQTNKADIVGAQLFDTPERRQVIDFSEPYYKSGQVYYVVKDSRFQTIDDLNQSGVRFVYGTGGAQGGLAKKYTPQASAQEVPLQGQLIPYQFLATDRADATMGEAAAYPVLTKRFTNPPLVAIGKNGRITADLPQQAESLDPFNVAFGLPKNDAGWKGCIDAWVTWGSASNGPLAQRVDHWLKNQK